jgi:hypothetical protein
MRLRLRAALQHGITSKTTTEMHSNVRCALAAIVVAKRLHSYFCDNDGN